MKDSGHSPFVKQRERFKPGTEPGRIRRRAGGGRYTSTSR